MRVHRISLRFGPVEAPAWEVRPESPPAAGAVVVHGYASSKEAMLGLSLLLAEAGLSCTVPDLPGHGEHPEPFGPRIVEEVQGAVEHARSHGPVLAVGHSLGGRLALLSGADAVVAVSPALPLQPSPEGMYGLTILSAPKVRQPSREAVIEVLRGLPLLGASRVPVLFVLGEGDIPGIVKATEELASSLGGAPVVRVAEGMLPEVEVPPPGFGSYLRHWLNHGGLPGTRAVAAEAVAWAGRVFPEAGRKATGGTDLPDRVG